MLTHQTKTIRPFKCPACRKSSQTGGMCNDCKQPTFGNGASSIKTNRLCESLCAATKANTTCPAGIASNGRRKAALHRKGRRATTIANVSGYGSARNASMSRRCSARRPSLD